MRFLPTFTAITLVLVATSVRSDVFPIVDGHQWHYIVEGWFPGTEHYTAYFDGVAEIDGRLTHVQRYSGDFYGGLVSYWSVDSEGDVYAHGVGSLPVLFLDVPLFLGKVWSTTIQTPTGPRTFRSEVLAMGPVTVPAGTFDCFSIARFGDSSLPYAVESYADGVGLVERGWLDPHRTEQLVSLPSPIAVVPMTWSAVRQLYR